MAYGYCRQCDNKYDAPDAQQIFQGHMTCPHCGDCKPIDESMKTDLLVQMVTEIEDLKKENLAQGGAVKRLNRAVRELRNMIVEE